MSGRLLVAVVDDEDDVLRALRRLIGAFGHAVETYSTGSDFLASLDDHLPDCVLLDLSMPDMTGFDVQARLFAQGRRLPVVIISANDDNETRQRAIDGGASDFLSKPMDADRLLSSIERATGVRHVDAPPGNHE